jgi:pSer/pThr/pTyr-binding forkhead associated (FHA) protein
MAKNVLVLKHFETPKEAGTYYRLMCLTGSNKGEAYMIVGNRIIIGRSEKADIRINDVKASREHAEVSRTGDSWYVTDLGSQNGVMVNDKKITQEKLTEGDKVIVGQTVFKFTRVEVNAKNRVLKEDAADGAGVSKKTMIPLIVLLLVFLFVMFDEEKPLPKPAPEPERGLQDISGEYAAAVKKKYAKEDKIMKEKLNTIYQRGLREYREGNYFRAIHEFNLALIMAPGDAQAEYYLRKTKEDLDSSIEGYIERAQRDENSLKYQSAVVSYCSIIRLLYSVQEDTRFKNAEKRIKDLEFKIGTETGETDCLKKQRTDQ